jgi:CHAT domain-containing protein/tetratricopeptide (TPR) repeat protein
MIRGAQWISGLVLVWMFAAAPAADPPPGSAAPKVRVSLDPNEIAKMYDHLTLKEMREWWRKYPSTEEEAKQALADIADAIRLMDESTALFQSRQIEQARRKMNESLAAFHRVFVEDSLMLSDMYGAFGVLLAQAGDVAGADDLFRRQRGAVEKAFPASRFPDGHVRLALALLTMGTGQLDLGRHAAAEKMFRDALKMYEKLGPANPDGSDMTTVYIQLTSAVFARKELVEAKVLAEKALARCEELSKSPEGRAKYGHLLAKAKNNLAEVLRASGDTSGRADELLREAIAIGGPAASAIKIRNLAELALGNRQWREALHHSDEALRIAERLYPTSEYPTGAPELLTILRTRGSVLAATGDLAAAEPILARCLKMARAIFPDERCPEGHPELASTLAALGDLRLRSPKREDQETAVRCFRDALTVSLGHTRSQAAYLAEADMLQLLDSAGGAVDGLLSANVPFDSRDYWFLWETKAAVMRIMDHRRRTVLASSDPAVRELDSQLQEARRALAAHADTTGGGGSAVDLARRKDELEARLSDALRLPLPSRSAVGPGSLAQTLPASAVFVDFWAYLKFEQTPGDAGNSGRRISPHYAAFVLTKDAVPVRIELGPTEPINAEVANWLAKINRNAEDPVAERQAAARVRALVWEPLEAAVAGKSAFYFCPDGVFGRLPFCALPNAKGREISDKILLEQWKFVEVPHGPGLVGHLRTPPAGSKGPVLALGDLDYGPGLRRLPASQLEIQSLQRIAGEARVEPVRVLVRSDASVPKVAVELPSVRIAHFATHGAADSPDAPLAGTETLMRNKLLGCRLALSGADNRGGTLSGEAITALRLNDLDLAVLSACNTAIGPVKIREGVFALRRAFHAAGCKAVAASLWPVDDKSTAALMARFYHHLWVEHRQPDDALREAQLDLYRSPRWIEDWAEGRRGGAVALPTAPIIVRESLPLKWAGFQLSVNHP